MPIIQIDFLTPIKHALAPLYGLIAVLILACGVTVLAAVATNIYLTFYTDMPQRKRKQYCRMTGQIAGTLAILFGALTLML
ncbi:hypothetical protein [Chromobacterium haemolyticum]|uniref:hypothetical protein n=1 Tax=Chromobacterium TaxID=535 RepID=UPI004056D9BF